LFQMRTAGNI